MVAATLVAGALCFALAVAARPASASDVELPELAGHPRERFPLAVYVAPAKDAKNEATIRRAIGDWNRLFRRLFGVAAFGSIADRSQAAVDVEAPEHPHGRLMGTTEIDADDGGVIRLPVKITLFPPRARGRTSSDVVLYQVAAHELGHALGLQHTADVSSIMCCVAGAVNFDDPDVRRRYVEARRRPRIDSVAAELEDHYTRFWRNR